MNNIQGIKNVNDVLNIPVVSILDGEEIATINSLIINCEKKIVEYVIIEKKENGKMTLEAIAYTDIVGIGCYAITVKSSMIPKDFKLLKLDGKEYKNNEEILSQRVLTEKGDYIGTVSGLDFKEDTGHINSITYKDDDAKDNKVYFDNILTIGQKLLIVSHSNSGKRLKKQFEESFKKEKLSKKDVSDSDVNDMDMESFLKNKKETAIGKILKSDILDYKGSVLIYKGTQITLELMEKLNNIDESFIYEILANV